MNRQKAESIYDAGREAVIEKLLSFDENIRQLKHSIAGQTRNSSNSSRPPSSDPPGMKKAPKKPKRKRKQGGQPGHFVAPEVVLFHVSLSRVAKVLGEVLGDTFADIITSDEHSAYANYHKNGLRQLCWSHIIRFLKALREDRSSHHAYCFARHMLMDTGAISGHWYAFQESDGSREQLLLDTLPMRERMNDFCIIFRDSSDQRVQTRTKRLLDNWQHLFTFLEHDIVQPTNNSSEWAIRPAVQWRKICFGSQSQIGEQFAGRLLTVARTCQLHDINVFFSAKQHTPSLPLSLPS